MIEINLVPDVKQEFIRARRVRSVVVSLTILVGAIAIAVVAILLMVVYGWQGVQKKLTNDKIESESAKLSAVEGLDSALTIQNQLGTLPAMHESKPINSRIFDILATLSPPESSTVAISKFDVDSSMKTITIEAQSAEGYPALEVFRKTIEATEFRFKNSNNEEESYPLATTISDGERSYGESANGERVLRFTLIIEYPEQLFTAYLDNARIVGPDRTNVTDSYLAIPKTLFSPKADDIKEGN